MDAEVEPGGELLRPLAVAVDHPADLEAFAENRPHAIAGVAHVNDDRKVQERREGELTPERGFLDIGR